MIVIISFHLMIFAIFYIFQIKVLKIQIRGIILSKNPIAFKRQKEEKIQEKTKDELIYGKKPIGEGFSQEKLFNLFSNSISTFIINFPEEPKISFDCKEFIKGCLQPRIELRMDVSEALSSKFIKQVCLIK